MDVANPIYDAAFKYLMQHDQAARMLVSRITGLAVRTLEFSAQEVASPRPDAAGERSRDPLLTLLRMDFAARVEVADGRQRQVLIEIQKAKAPTVIERFRRYLGEQYRNPANLQRSANGTEQPVPLITIYLLGYDLGLSDEALIDVNPCAVERRTGRTVDADHPFIAGTCHHSHIVQIPRLRGRRRDELERFLSIFDQGLAAGRSPVLLSVDESEYPPECRVMLWRLRQAAETDDVRRFMEAEELLLKDSIELSRQAEHQRQRAELEQRRAEQERRRAQKAEQQAQRAEQQAQRAEQQARHDRHEKEQERQRAEQAEQRVERERREAARRLVHAVRALRSQGLDAAAIAAALSVDAGAVRDALQADPG